MYYQIILTLINAETSSLTNPIKHNSTPTHYYVDVDIQIRNWFVDENISLLILMLHRYNYTKIKIKTKFNSSISTYFIVNGICE